MAEQQARISYRAYDGESDDLNQIINLMESELSEPYIIYTYRYFLTSWPHLCFLCFSEGDDPGGHPAQAIGAVVCKQDVHRGKLNRGYIAMLTTKKEARKKGIARKLVQMAMQRMIADGAQEIVLETEYDNSAALAFYQKLGFIREKRLYAFYLNHKDAFRLVCPIPAGPEHQEEDLYI
ncbi:N-alpha-acetyltransferase mak3 [Puccinia graminis f. sp. tritici]|uniref:N-alpha-acetyltransferase mak3 n=1 Tax=Puccinia graminis f. sp. tritici TaxID=56615 RepID=A0A5B0NJ03_PUCGR|nr:N-alpha-acetyltransferase mak3 [Puccinia graminis f. sp. tritici]KAA1102131.1 N-alpha-acetyltransferase mak3 [Puccinia graminis f. sp. tritici]